MSEKLKIGLVTIWPLKNIGSIGIVINKKGDLPMMRWRGSMETKKKKTLDTIHNNNQIPTLINLNHTLLTNILRLTNIPKLTSTMMLILLLDNLHIQFILQYILR